MNPTIKTNGSCLCGAVEIRADKMSSEVGACHCNMCRNWSSGPFLAVDCRDAVTFVGEEHISTYQSSDWAERGFCSRCGSHLFYRLKQNNQYIVSAGIFHEEQGLHFDHQIFIEEKPAYYTFSNETKNMTGAEVFAQFTE